MKEYFSFKRRPYINQIIKTQDKSQKCLAWRVEMVIIIKSQRDY